MRDLLLVGTGGFGREVAEAVRSANAHQPVWRVLGFLDDDPRTHGRSIGGFPVLGPAEAVHDHATALVLLLHGTPGQLCEPGRDRGATRPQKKTAMRRSCTRARPWAQTSSVGPGSVLLAHVDVTADAKIGRHVAVCRRWLSPTTVGSATSRRSHLASAWAAAARSSRARTSAAAYAYVKTSPSERAR